MRHFELMSETLGNDLRAVSDLFALGVLLSSAFILAIAVGVFMLGGGSP